MTDKKYELEVRFEIFELNGTKLTKPTYNDYGRDAELFSTCQTLQEAEEDILERGETLTEYTILPVYRKTDF